MGALLRDLGVREAEGKSVPPSHIIEFNNVRGWHVYTVERVTSHGTVDNYVAGVRSLQKLAGYPVPSANAPNLKLVMDGIKAFLAKPVNQATPMTTEILNDIAQVVDYNNEFEHCVFVAMLTGFYLVVRSSNLVPLSSPTFNP